MKHLRTRLIAMLLAAVCLFCLVPGSALAEDEALTEDAALELKGEENMEWTCGMRFKDPGYTVHGSGTVTVQGEVCCWRVGNYTLKYQLKDGEKILAQKTRKVRVVPAPLPETVAVPNAVYLTFDDGPSDFTKKALDTLKKYNVKATFFIVANHTTNLDMLKRIVDEGHTLGIHCYDHNYGKLYRDEETFFEDWLTAQDIVYRYTGTYAKVSRFPGSSRTAGMLAMQLPGKFDELKELMHNMGIRYYDWDQQPELGKSRYDVEYSFTHPKEPYDGDIFLQHDTRQFSVDALDAMIRWGLKEGYTFLPIDSTTPEVHFR